MGQSLPTQTNQATTEMVLINKDQLIKKVLTTLKGLWLGGGELWVISKPV